MTIMDYFVVLGAAIGVSFASSYSFKTQKLSTNLFLVAFAIAILVLIWVPILPIVALLIPIAIIAILIFKPTSSGGGDGIE